MEAARELFETFRVGGINYLRRALREPPMQESLLLDFKRIEGDSAPMTKADTRTLGTALSGFANAEGGVLVWGVEAKSTGPGDPDAAKSLHAIANLDLLYSDLQTRSSQVVSPALVGVEHHIIRTRQRSNSGFALTYIPKAEHGLHMAVAGGQHTYYFRSSTSFLPMEAYMVADRLGRRPQPHLTFGYRLLKAERTSRNSLPDGSGFGTTYHRCLYIGVGNSGLGIATYPALSVRTTSYFQLCRYGIDGNTNTGLPMRPSNSLGVEDSARVFAGGTNDVVYPDTTLFVTCADLTIPDRKTGAGVEIEYRLMSEGFSGRGRLVIPWLEVLHAAA